MSPRAVATMAVRLIAVYALIPFAGTVGSVLNTLLLASYDHLPSSMIVANSMRSILLLVASIVLWALARPLGQAITPQEGQMGKGNFDLPSLAAVGFGITGVVLVVLGAANLAMGPALAGTVPVQMAGVAQTGIGFLYSGLVEVVLGLLVFVGRSGLGRVLSAARRY